MAEKNERHDKDGRQLYPWEVTGKDMADHDRQPEESDEARRIREAQAAADLELTTAPIAPPPVAEKPVEKPAERTAPATPAPAAPGPRPSAPSAPSGSVQGQTGEPAGS